MLESWHLVKAVYPDLTINRVGSTTKWSKSAVPVTLQVDASEDAICGALLQNAQPVCFTSHSLNSTERNYTQIENECPKTVTRMNKWHQYLYGKWDITVQPCHEPHKAIFNKPMSKAPHRLQRMMLKLQLYNSSLQSAPNKGKEFYVALKPSNVTKLMAPLTESEAELAMTLS